VDKNGNGDLTEEGERFVLVLDEYDQKRGKRAWKAGAITTPDGKTRYTGHGEEPPGTDHPFAGTVTGMTAPALRMGTTQQPQLLPSGTSCSRVNKSTPADQHGPAAETQGPEAAQP
jgi:hypothetical protein